MEDQKDVIEGISTQALELLLREQIGDETATITDCRLTVMPHNGFGGQHLIQAKVFWTGMGGSTSADWVVKQWRPGGPTRIVLNISLPLEALSWKHGLIRPAVLPEGIIVPIVGVILDEVDSSAWIVMEDISSELAVFSSVKSRKDRFEQTSFMLDKLASWHVAWEHPKRQAALMAHSWLIQQETRLWSGAAFHADCLGQEPHHLEQVPDKPLARRRVKIFLNWLSEADRVLWEKHLPDREVLVKACSNLPQTLLHGDLDPRNIGPRWLREWLQRAERSIFANVRKSSANYQILCADDCRFHCGSRSLLQYYGGPQKMDGGIGPQSADPAAAIMCLTIGDSRQFPTGGHRDLESSLSIHPKKYRAPA